MLQYHFPLTSSSATSTIVNKGLKSDYTISGDNNFSSGGKLSAYAKDMGEDKLYLSIPNFSLDYTLCFRAKATSNILLVCVGYTPYEITADNTWHDYVICDKKVYKDGLFLTNYNYSAGIVTFGDSEDSCQGLIQDIRIYDYALSLAEINEYSRALVVHYPLNSNVLNGNAIKDCSGLGNDLEVLRDDGYSYETNSPRYTKGMCLHGDYINIIPVTSINQGIKFKTFSFWFKPLSFVSQSSYYSLFSIRLTDGDTKYTIASNIVKNDRNGLELFNGDFYLLNTPINNHSFITLVIEDNYVRYYKDGVLSNSKAKSSFTSTQQNIIWGGYIDTILSNLSMSTVLGTGKITLVSDFRVYATALSAEDIKNLYNSPISLDNKHNTTAFEFKENPLYPSKYWRTPTYDEMNYILNTRANASNLRTLGRVDIDGNGTYVNGCFLLPDDWVTPSGITINIITANYTDNTYSLEEFRKLEGNGAVFFPCAGRRIVNKEYQADYLIYHTGTIYSNTSLQYVTLYTLNYEQKYVGKPIRLCHNSQSNHSFSTSANTKIDFAPANLQYHCMQHIWRFAEHSYDYIGADNTNIDDNYNGWIDLFGYGTSGRNVKPTESRASNNIYPSIDISNTDNDWGINEIQSYDYNVKNFAANKNGIVQHNELNEYDLLPQEYQLVEYLESTGEQWIDTEYIPQLADDIYAEVAFTELLQQNIGCLESIGGSFYRCHFSCNASQEKLQIFYDTTSLNVSKNYDTDFHIYQFTSSKVYIDTTSMSNSNIYPNLSFYLFARNYTSLTPCKAKTKIFKVNGKVGMYPCYRKSDGKPGMYDIIRHKFFTNKGTGADFLVGNDVPKINGIYKDKILTNKLIEN